MCVSTGKAGSPKACTLTTLAVLWPTPGSVSSVARSRGTRSPCSSTSARESAAMFLALVGARPQLRIKRWISPGFSFAIAAGVEARAKSAGVTWLTRASVHCADSTTATSKVKGSSCWSGIAASGYKRSRIFPMRRAFSLRVTRSRKADRRR